MVLDVSEPENYLIPSNMIQTQEQIKIDISINGDEMHLDYAPKTDRTLFDICDVHGRILKTGQILKRLTTVFLNELDNDNYILLILDGDRVCSRRFSVSR
jgi:hypothetical protein